MVTFLSLMFTGVVIGLCLWYFLWRQSPWWPIKGFIASIVILALAQGIAVYVLPLLVTIVGYTVAIAFVIGAAVLALAVWGRLFLRARAGG